MDEQLRCASCDDSGRPADSNEDDGSVDWRQPYATLGYDAALPLHESCGRVATQMASRCLLCMRPAAGTPLYLFVIDDGPPVVSHERCAVGGTEVRPDGITRRKCLVCRTWSGDVQPYDLGDGKPAWLDAPCARRVAGSALHPVKTGLLVGAVLAALTSVSGR